MADPSLPKVNAPTKPMEHPIGGSSFPNVPKEGVIEAPKSSLPPRGTASAIPPEYLGAQMSSNKAPVKLPKTLEMPKTAPPSLPTSPPAAASVKDADKDEISPKERKELEQKAKTLIKEIDKTHPAKTTTAGVPPPKKKSKKPALVGLASIALVLTGIGIFAGIKMLGIPGSQEPRGIAANRCSGITDRDECNDTACCKWGNGKCGVAEGAGCIGGGNNECPSGSGLTNCCADAVDCASTSTCSSNTHLATQCHERSNNNVCWSVSTCSDICRGSACTTSGGGMSCPDLQLGTSNGHYLWDKNDVSHRCEKVGETVYDGGVINYLGDDQKCVANAPTTKDERKVSYADCSSKCNYTWQAVSFCDNSCPWELTNGQCCPTGNDACSKEGELFCVSDPFVSRCEPWPNSSCPAGQQYYRKAIAWCADFCAPDCPDVAKDACCKSPTNPPNTQPPQQPSPTPTTEAMVCTGVTLTPATPVYGGVVTLTCTGTPGSLATYADFQVQVGSGTYQSVTNKTATTAEYTVNSVGTFTVRCRMCTSSAKTNCTAWQTSL